MKLRRHFQPLLLCGFLFLAPLNSIASQVVYQNFAPGSDPINVVRDVGQASNYAIAQRFIPNATGLLDSISAFISTESSDAPLLIVDIRSDLYGSSLATATTTSDQFFPDRSLKKIDFTGSNVELVANQVYFAVFRVAHSTGAPGDGYYDLWSVPDGPYSGMSAPLFSQDGGQVSWYDVPLSHQEEVGLVVTVVPEPATASLFFIAAALVANYYSRSRCAT